MQDEQEPKDQTAGWSFNTEGSEQLQESEAMPGKEVTWTASEYIAHHKGPGWYMGLALTTVAVTALTYLITQDMVTAVVIVIVAIIFGVFASRQPQVLTYKLQDNGIVIEDKFYPYGEFRSFAVQEEGAINSIFLMPLKRFHPGLSLYYPPEQEDEIINTLGSYLPHEDRQPDIVDRFMRNIRF